MSPEILLVVAAVLLAAALIGVLLRRGARDDGTSGASETPAEPGSEGMNVVDDGEISPGPGS